MNYKYDESQGKPVENAGVLVLSCREGDAEIIRDVLNKRGTDSAEKLTGYYQKQQLNSGRIYVLSESDMAVYGDHDVDSTIVIMYENIGEQNSIGLGKVNQNPTTDITLADAIQKRIAKYAEKHDVSSELSVVSHEQVGEQFFTDMKSTFKQRKGANPVAQMLETLSHKPNPTDTRLKEGLLTNQPTSQYELSK